MKPSRVTVLYNVVDNLETGNPTDILADQDTIKTAKSIAKALGSIGYITDLFDINPNNVNKLKQHHTDFFFNNAFGIGSVAKSESDVAVLLEKTKIPFCGATAKNIILTTDKVATKKLLMSQDLPTPNFQVFSNGDKLDRDLDFPLMVKPSDEDSSLGINQTSIVNNPDELYKKVNELKNTYKEKILVEEYIDGRELNVSILKNTEVLPISEIIFGSKFPGKYKIVDFASKWNEDTNYFSQTNGICPAKLSSRVQKKIEEISLTAYQLTSCRDYARIDLRLDRNNNPWILEVNANPGIGPDDGLVRSARVAGYSYARLLDAIVCAAYSRSH